MPLEGPGSGAPQLFGTSAGATIFSLVGIPNVTIEGFRMSAVVNGGAAASSVTAISETSSDGLVVSNDSFDGFQSDNVVLFFGNNDSVTYNTFWNLGSGANMVNVNSATNATLQHNILAPPAGPVPTPALDAKALLALTAMLLAGGLIASQRGAVVANPIGRC